MQQSAIPKGHLRKGQRIALLSMIMIFLLSILKALVGYIFNSPLLIADAWHSGVDILINFASFAGLWTASRKKTTRFPYGLYKAETMACLLIGIIITFIGFDMLKQGWSKLFLVEIPGSFPWFPISASIISCLLSWLLAIKQKKIGKEINSQALLTTGREAFIDIFTSLFVLMGILLVYFKIPYIEGSIIILISILILRLGFEAAWKSVLILMDANLDPGMQAEIEDKLLNIQGIKSVVDLKIRQSGPFKMVECIIKTTPSLALYKSHELADKAENMMLENYSSIESVFIHVEPEKRSIEKALIPVLEKNGLNSKIYHYFGRAPYYAAVTIDNNQISIDSYYSNEFLNEKGHIGLSVVKSIVDLNINVIFTRNLGEIAFHTLKNHYIEIFKVEQELSIEKILDLYKENLLKPLVYPNLSKQKF